MAAKLLTKEEKAWLKKLQAVLDECPSKRIGSFTSGGFDLQLYDTEFDQRIDDTQTRMNCVMGVAVDAVGAGIGSVDFPFTIQHG